MKTVEDLVLPAKPTLADYQKYENDMEEVHGFSDQTKLQKCLILGEEVGELFKAIRKAESVKVDSNSKFGTIPEELADCFILILAIANKYNIDLEKAFRDKEEVNKKRNWSSSN